MPNSIIDLASRVDAAEFFEVRELYEISLQTTPKLWLDEHTWERAWRTFRLPRHEVAEQQLAYVRCRFRGVEAMFNELRGARFAVDPPDPAACIDEQRHTDGCHWCDPNDSHICCATRCVEEVSASVSSDGRFATCPNWARLAAVSSLVLGDETAHSLFSLSRADFVTLFDLGSRHVEKFARANPKLRYFTLFLNGGPRSASSVAHTHLQVSGREDRHVGWAERIARYCPPDYWPRVQSVHEKLGLAFRAVRCSGWASLCPEANKEITLISPDVSRGAEAMFDVLREFRRHGTTSFSLVAILSPTAAGARDNDDRFAAWPQVVWRFADRGDIRLAHADVGSMELLAGTNCVAADPWRTAHELDFFRRKHA